MDFHGKILLKYVCLDVGTQNLEVYPNTLLIIQTHVEENELRVQNSKRSWLEKSFVVLETCIRLSLWVEVIYHQCQNFQVVLPQCLSSR